ncbi:MAG: 16S rRNA (uracil(1498)-N(3))-methyltransferase [Armatimonadetes bacterium]|nr:16S rRNA (uracil(1498)-N(3))-methyltransferase [Armatimonadota bacterium]
MRRFIAPPNSVTGNRVTLRNSQARHVAVVLRLRPGDRVVVLDGTGREFEVELESIAAEEVIGRIVSAREGRRPVLHLALLQGVPKGAKMDDVIRMGTEVGVAEFVPFLSERTVAEGRQRVGRWLRIATEAAKQCRRSDVPVVHEPMPFHEALEKVSGYDRILVLWEGEQSRSIAHALTNAHRASRAAVIVGPEGGLQSREVEEATSRGAIPVTLGPLILRTETAGIVAIAMVLYELTLRTS